MSEVSSNPHAWLCSFWSALKQQPFFDRLAPELQAEQLAAALESDYPAKAREIREWNAATRRAMLAVLDEGVRAGKSAKEVELWRMQKGEREVRCVAVYLPSGVDLRLIEGGELQRTELFRDGVSVVAAGRRWQRQNP
jgi:hypothetical protein